MFAIPAELLLALKGFISVLKSCPLMNVLQPLKSPSLFFYLVSSSIWNSTAPESSVVTPL